MANDSATTTLDTPKFDTSASAKPVAAASIPSKAAEWRRCLLLAFVGLPVFAVLSVCAYGFIIWFMQILFWGPPR